MDNKKLCIIFLIILLFILITAGIFLKTRKTEIPELKPAENVLVEEEIIIEEAEDKQVKEETEKENINQKQTKSKTTSKPNKKSESKLKPPANNDEVQQVSVEKTDINSELLKKEPRADVVVIDREYKVRRLGKYIFK